MSASFFHSSKTSLAYFLTFIIVNFVIFCAVFNLHGNTFRAIPYSSLVAAPSTVNNSSLRTMESVAVNVEESRLIKLAADIERVGCASGSGEEVLLEVDPVDCVLFCLGRFYSSANLDPFSNLCFCSNSTQSNTTLCTHNSFHTYLLYPKTYTIPTVSVIRQVST